MVRIPVDVLRERAVHDRARLARPQEGPPRVGQPHDAHHDQDRHHREGEQAELEVEHEQHGDDADEEHEVADREDGGLQELLERVHVALQPGHEPPDLGLVHERERDVLQVPVHRAAEIEEQACRDPADHDLLHEVGGVVEPDDREERDDDEVQHREPGIARDEGVVDRVAQHERNRDLGEGEHEHRRHPDPDPPAVGRHEGPEAPHHPPVEGGAEHLLLERDLRADHRPRGPERRCGLRGGLHPASSTSISASIFVSTSAASGSPSVIRVCRAYSAA